MTKMFLVKVEIPNSEKKSFAASTTEASVFVSLSDRNSFFSAETEVTEWTNPQKPLCLCLLWDKERTFHFFFIGDFQLLSHLFNVFIPNYFSKNITNNHFVLLILLKSGEFPTSLRLSPLYGKKRTFQSFYTELLELLLLFFSTTFILENFYQGI